MDQRVAIPTEELTPANLHAIVAGWVWGHLWLSREEHVDVARESGASMKIEGPRPEQ